MLYYLIFRNIEDTLKKSLIIILILISLIISPEKNIQGEETSKPLTEEQLKKEKVYFSLKEALKNPL